MNTYTVSFCGHRAIDNPLALEKALYELVATLLRTKEFVEFLVGRDGEFDQIVSSAIRRGKREVREDNSSHIWVMPYMTAAYRNHEDDYRKYYDEIEVFELCSIHYKAAFQARNRSMVDRSDLIIFMVERQEGGAYQTLRYAMNQSKQYINLADTLEK